MRIALLIGPRSEAAPVIVLDVPSDFHQVPLERETEARTASQLRVLEEMGLDDTAQREALSLYLEALAVRLSAGNVVGTAFCAVEIDGHPSTATLTVAMHDTHTLDRGLAALGAAESMRRDSRFSQVELVQLGQAPGAAAVAERPSVPGEALDGTVGSTLRELSVFVPVEGFEQAAMVTLSTPCLEDWQTYRDLVFRICSTMQVSATHPDFIK